MINRRNFLKFVPIIFSLSIVGHAPWGQWQVYRQRHMLFLSTIEDKPSYPFSKILVEMFEKYLPEASPRPARAKDFMRVHSLLISDQMPVAVLSKEIAHSLIQGKGKFKAYSPVEMKLLYDFGDMVLIARPKMPNNHAWRIVDAIIRSNNFKIFNYENDLYFDLHQGALGALKGDPMPIE